MKKYDHLKPFICSHNVIPELKELNTVQSLKNIALTIAHSKKENPFKNLDKFQMKQFSEIIKSLK